MSTPTQPKLQQPCLDHLTHKIPDLGKPQALCCPPRAADLPGKTYSTQMPAMCPGTLFLHHFPGYSKPIIYSFYVSQFSCKSLSLMPKRTPSFSISSPSKVLCPADFISTKIFQFGSYYQCPTSFPDGLCSAIQQTPPGSPIPSGPFQAFNLAVISTL